MATGLAAFAERLRGHPKITVLTGAGVSAASGVPTFRGPEGLWRSFRPEDLATPSAFTRDPRLVWEWYEWRRERIARCQPNRAHDVLAAWSHRYPGFTLITQNVDGLHERAGTQGVLRFHGSIWEVRCCRGCSTAPASWRDDTIPFPDLPPRCPHCAGLIRPGVVWFGEPIVPEILRLATEATRCDLFLTVGTSALVFPAAGLIDEARRAGAFTVEINSERTSAARLVNLAIEGRAEDVLQRAEEMIAEG